MAFEKIYQEGSSNVFSGSLLIEGEPLRVGVVDSLTLEVEFPRPLAAAEFLLSTVPVLPRHRYDFLYSLTGVSMALTSSRLAPAPSARWGHAAASLY